MRDIRFGQMATAAGLTSLTAAGTFRTGANSLVGARTFHQVLNGTGALTCAYTIDGSNDNGQTWVNLYANASFNGSTQVTDGFSVAVNQAWAQFRVNVTAIGGTGATFTCWAAEQVQTEA